MKRESIESIESIVQINILQSIQALEPLTLRPLSKEQIISNKNNYEFLKVVHGTSKRLPELINDTTVYYLADKVSLDKIPPTLSHKDGKYNVLSKERADTKYRAVVGPADFIKDDKLDFFVGNNDKDSKKHLPEAYKKENRLETTVITIPGINLKKFGPVKENPADFERVFVDGKFNGDNYKKNLKDILLFVLKIADLKELSALIIPKIGCGVYVSELEQNDKEKIVEIFGEALKEAIKESNYQGTIVLCLPNSSNGLNPDLNTLGYILDNEDNCILTSAGMINCARALCQKAEIANKVGMLNPSSDHMIGGRFDAWNKSSVEEVLYYSSSLPVVQNSDKNPKLNDVFRYVPLVKKDESFQLLTQDKPFKTSLLVILSLLKDKQCDNLLKQYIAQGLNFDDDDF